MKNLISFLDFSDSSTRLSENNDDLDLDGLVSSFQNLGINMSEEEIQMKKFMEMFGREKDPQEWAEYLFDYYHNPAEYDIEEDSEYYEQICQFYEDSVEPHKRFDLHGPMRFGNFQRFDLDSIEETPEYRLYLKVSRENR